ncbi:hypothetical protein BC940DRAFT_311023 [Gongronella butleri]|nr:hypothetical protein BC940DRAFT_311023 [Gongronella butleri]
MLEVSSSWRRAAGESDKVTQSQDGQSHWYFQMVERVSAPHSGTSSTGAALTSAQAQNDHQQQALTFSQHIYRRGLLEGLGSDIIVRVPAWQGNYRLHRLVLDQNPYFQAMIRGGFKESTALEQSDVTLHFEDHRFITEDSFEFILASLYGKPWDPLDIDSANACERLATCSFFHMDGLAELCVVHMLDTLGETTFVDYLCFADAHVVYGSDRLCDGIFAYLCREAYDLPIHLLANIPPPWIKKLVLSDAFWVPSEYERYRWLERIIQFRHKHALDTHTSDQLVLHQTICQGVYYIHMSFNQLCTIRSDINPVDGHPLVPDNLIKDALWLQTLFRSKIEAAEPGAHQLHLSCDEQGNPTPPHPTNAAIEASEDEQDAKQQTAPSMPASAHASAASVDVNEPLAPKSSGSSTGSPSPSTSSSSNSKHSPPTAPLYSIPSHDTTGFISLSHLPANGPTYSEYPPFRFSVEFHDLSSLKRHIRVYSKPVFYAGSLWNMYIQKTKSQRKGSPQLGVYLHRQAIIDAQSSSLSQYVDRRKVTKTWFKICSPSPKHTLTLFQSVPDDFSHLQSWGWRSTVLCCQQTDPVASVSSSPDHLTQGIGRLSVSSSSSPETIPHDHTLRFSVVLGHV